ncbi:MAG: sugar phosphate isomerase/epimerase [Termitinemataceae bacterium]|nr:MAG: sugar phosphate isomerase/epimerase [Termitinemataceae bacterium]
MKYGIYFAYWINEWDGADYKKYIDKVAKLGFDILEISCASLKEQYASDSQLFDLRDYAKEKGVILTAGYGPGKNENLSSSDPQTVKNAKAFYKDILLKLKKLDIHQLGGGIYSYWPVDYSQSIDKEGDWRRSVAGMKEIAAIAGDCGVTLGMEALNRFEGYLINSCEEALKYVNEVNHPNVKIMLDTFHMNIEEDNMAAAIRMAGDKLGHFHIGEQNRKVPGKGNIPWNDLACALKDINYDGTVVMEPFVMPGGGVGQDIKVWRNLIPDTSEAVLDRDAKSALEFIKCVFTK